MVQTLTSSVASCLSVEYSVVVLPEPVGPVTRMMPLGCSIIDFQRALSCDVPHPWLKANRSVTPAAATSARKLP